MIPKGAKVLINRGSYLGRKGEVIGHLETEKTSPVCCVYIGGCDVVPCSETELEVLKCANQ